MSSTGTNYVPNEDEDVDQYDSYAIDLFHKNFSPSG